MKELLQDVLNKKDLSKAGELFQVTDSVFLGELPSIIAKIIEITSLPDYSHNVNDQSVVEICITRITSAIRENDSVEAEGVLLVLLMQSCLNHNLRPTAPDTAPPHAKIAADIVACIFMHYQQPSVMSAALPVAVKLLHKGNSDLSRSISSYLSLAATHSAPLLAQYTHTIVDSVIAGNYSLARILPRLYREAEEPLHRHIMTLVSLLPRCLNAADSQPLLQLFALVAAHKPALLENSLPQLVDCLVQPYTVLSTLHVLLVLARWRPVLLVPHMNRVMTAVDNQLEALTVGLQTVCAIGCASSDTARAALGFVAGRLHAVEKSGLADVLREVGSVISKHHDAVPDQLMHAIKECESVTSHTALLHMLNKKHSSSDSMNAKIIKSSSGDVTIVNITSNNNICYTSSNSVADRHGDGKDAFYSSSRDRISPVTDKEMGGVKTGVDLTRSFSRELPQLQVSAKDLLTPSVREALSQHAHTDHISSLYQQHGTVTATRQHKYQKHSTNTSTAGANNTSEGWRSAGRLIVSSSNRSMPRLSGATSAVSSSSGRLGSSSIQLNKSLTRLNGSHHALTSITRSITVLTPTSTTRPVSSPFTTVSSSSSSVPPYSAAALPPDSITTTSPFPPLYPSIGIPPLLPGQTVSVNKTTPMLPSSSSNKRFSTHFTGLPSSSTPNSKGHYNQRYSTGPSITRISSSPPPSYSTPAAFKMHGPSPVPMTGANDSTPGKSKSSSIGTLKGSSESAPSTSIPLTNTSQDSGTGSIDGPATTTVITTCVTTTTATNSSGAVTSASSGSVCGSAGSLSNNNNNKGSSSASNSVKHKIKILSDIDDSEQGTRPVMRSNPTSSAADPQRVSVFEPYAMKDTVQHFCEKHREKIKAYMQKVFVKLPLPVKCLIEERKKRKYAKLFFSCQGKGEHCLYNVQLFCIKVRYPRVWIHLMFLALQAKSPSALSSRETQVSSLRHCWDTINSDTNVSFLTLVTAAFPSAKDMDALMQDLRGNRFFDVFQYNGIKQQWGCFLCNHPDRAKGFMQDGTPVIEGQLKEKKSKWKIFRKWRTRYFTLSGGHLSYRDREDKTEKGDIDVQHIRSVKVSKSGRHIPKAFEIFTDNKSFVLKAKDSSHAEEWVRCLSIAVAQQHVKSSSGSGPLYTSNSMPLHHHSSAVGSSRPNSVGVHCSSGSVWPSTRVSSNTSLPRSLLYSPTSSSTASPLHHHPGMAPTPTPQLPLPSTLLHHTNQIAPHHSTPSVTTPCSGGGGTLPPGLQLIRSNV